MNIPSIVLSGPSIDRFIRKYGIDVNNDMIVCAQGAGSNGAYMNQGRCWFTLSYWGVEQKNIAVLNGNNDHLVEDAQLGASYFTDTTVVGGNPSPIIGRQVSSVKDLKADNTALYASIEDVINVLPLTDAPDNGDGIMLWDARNLPQYSAGKFEWKDKAITVTAADGSRGFQNNAPRQSHPRGAFNLEFTNMLDTTTGLYYDKATLAAIVKGGLSPDKKQGFVSGGTDESYQLVQTGNAYQPGDTIIHYCETSMRAGVTIIPAAVILGIPSRLYDSAMIEWNSLTSGSKDVADSQKVPASSPWNTEFLSAPTAVYGTNISPRTAQEWATKINADAKVDAEEVTAKDVVEGLLESPLITNAFAEHANLIPEEDKAYKAPVVTNENSGNNSGSGSSSGGSAALPTNPCG